MGEPRDVTRRALLGGVAAAGAASLVRPVAGLAAARNLAPNTGRAVFSAAVGSLSGESRPILARQMFSLAGVQWRGSREAKIQLRAQAPGGRWTEWVTASALGHDPDRTTRPQALFGDPVWTGLAGRVQL